MHDLKRAFGTPDEQFQRRTRQTLRRIESKEASRRPARKSPSLSVALSFALGLALILSSVFALSQRISTPKADSTLPLARGSLSGSPLPIEALRFSPTPEPTAEYATPEPTADSAAPYPTDDYVTAKPAADSAAPYPTDDYVTAKPAGDYVTSEPTGDYVTSEPAGDSAAPYPTISAVPFSLTNELPVDEGSYYYAPDGVYYHAASDCSGLHAALPVSPNEVVALGLTACPVCLGDHSAEIAYDASDHSLILYASESDSHYHLIPDCPDQADGETLSEDALLLRISCEELTFCPTCQIKLQSAATIGLADSMSDAPLSLYAIENDLYYHLIPGCPEQADGETLSNDALFLRISCEKLTFCPTCASALTVQSSGEINGAH